MYNLHRIAPLLRDNPTPFKALVRITDEDGLAAFKEAGFHASREATCVAAQAEAERLDRAIPSNTRLAHDNCRTVSIDWGTAFYPYLDDAGQPVRGRGDR